MAVVEGGNVLHHIKRMGIVREGEMSGEYVRGGYVRITNVLR